MGSATRRTGRPPKGAVAGTVVSLRLEPSLLERVDAALGRIRTREPFAAGLTRSEALRVLIARALDAEERSSPPAIPSSAAPAPADLGGRILAEVNRLRLEEGRLVPIWRMRAAVGSVDREAFDEALRSLEAAGRVWLNRRTDPRGMTEEERRGSMRHGTTGELLFYVSTREDGPGAPVAPTAITRR